MSSEDVRYIVADTLYNMGFEPHYIRRSLSLYHKHYDCSKIGYDIQIITEIIFRLSVKDKLKKSQQKLYHSKVNMEQALECIGFTPKYIEPAIKEYENIYGLIQSYDIQIIVQLIMQLRARDYRPQKRTSALRIKVDKVHAARTKTLSFDTNDSGDTPKDTNIISPTMDMVEEETKREEIVSVKEEQHSGYLWKQSSKQESKWQKRWFVARNDQLQYFADAQKASNYFASNKHDDKDRKGYIGAVSSCKVNKVVIRKHKYVLSVTTPLQRTYLLKASNRKQYDQWMTMLSSPETKSLALRESKTANCNSMGHSCVVVSDERIEYKQKQMLLYKIQDTNKYCADCNQTSPDWVSINIGVVLCVDCCAIHRELGTSVSKMRSLVLDDLNLNTLKSIVRIGGNKRLNNELLEYTLPESRKIHYAQCSAKERADFIYYKYVNRLYINTNDVNIFNVNQHLFDAAERNDCLTMLMALYNKANIDYVFGNNNNMTALQVAILKNNEEAAELLMNNNATPVLQI